MPCFMDHILIDLGRDKERKQNVDEVPWEFRRLLRLLIKKLFIVATELTRINTCAAKYIINQEIIVIQTETVLF